MPWPHSRIRTRQLQHRPTCAVCKVPVASFTEARDEFIDRVVFTASCHGATEVASVDCATADRMGAITWGPAFAAPLALPAPVHPEHGVVDVPAPAAYRWRTVMDNRVAQAHSTNDGWSTKTPDEILADLASILGGTP